MVGGWLFVHADWHSIFWFLALIGPRIWFSTWRNLPETLHSADLQRFDARTLLAGYRQMATSPRFMTLVLASGIPFNGMFLYVLAAPVFLGEHLQLGPTQFFWFFMLTIGGILSGAWASGRLAGRIKPRHQVRHGLLIMLVVSLLNVALNALFEPHWMWSMLPVAVFSFGWALMVPVVTLLVLDEVPTRRGMASMHAGLHRRGGQRHRGRCGGATGHAFDPGAGAGVVGHAPGGHCGLGLGEAAPGLIRPQVWPPTADLER
jgi:DHA1 family bicyclomycin/chloramphenicol resistance-like MFS transporter